jgi:hypothetical protein
MSKMIRRVAAGVGGGALLIVGVLLASPPAQAQWVQSSKAPPVKVISCLVYSTVDAQIKYDCTAVASGSCNGKSVCKLPIGYNLTAGKDIDAKGGFLGKMVKVTYACGGVSGQVGPYQQDNHATLDLTCGGAGG